MRILKAEEYKQLLRMLFTGAINSKEMMEELQGRENDQMTLSFNNKKFPEESSDMAA